MGQTDAIGFDRPRRPTRRRLMYAAVTVALGLATFAMVNSMGLIARAVGEQSMWVILLLPAAGFPLVGLGGAIWVWRFSRAAPPAGNRPTG